MKNKLLVFLSTVFPANEFSPGKVKNFTVSDKTNGLLDISKEALPISAKRFLLPLIILIGVVLRIYSIGTESLTFDEIYSVRLAHMSIPALIAETSRDFHPPLYYLLLHFWSAIFSDSEIAVRSLSALFGIVSIFMIFLISRHIFDEKTGFFAAFLLSVSHLNIQFSQDARMYTLLALLSICSMYFFLKLLNENTRFYFIGFVVSNILMLYTHVYSYFIIAAELIYFASLFFYARDHFQKNIRVILKSFLIVFVAFSPWMFVFYRQFLFAQHYLWIPKATLLEFPEILIEYSGSILLAIILLPLMVLSVMSFQLTGPVYKKSKLFEKYETMEFKIRLANTEEVYFLLLWLFIPLILPYILSKIFSPIFLVKYTIASSMAFIILVAAGFSRIKTEAVKYILLIVVCGLTAFNYSNEWKVPTKERWKEAIGYLDKSATEGDLVIFHSGVCKDFYKYYSQKKNLRAVSFDPLLRQMNNDSLSFTLGPLAKENSHLWLIVSHPKDSRGEIARFLKNNFDSTSQTQFSSNYRKYFFSIYYQKNEFEVYLLKTYFTPDISVYYFGKGVSKAPPPEAQPSEAQEVKDSTEREDQVPVRTEDLSPK